MSIEGLIGNAYAGELEHHHRTERSPYMPEQPPRDLGAVLRMVDYIVQQRILEHFQRDPHRATNKPRR